MPVALSSIANLLFTDYIIAFEATSALLITAALGAMVLAHRERWKRLLTQKEQSQARTRMGAGVVSLPNPGIYARHNAVDTPGLLPDGTPSLLTVPEPVRGRGEVRPTQLPAIDPVADDPRAES